MPLINYLRNALTSKSLAEQIEERDHELDECSETYQVKPGVFTVERCDVCRKQHYSFKDFDDESP